MELLILLLVVPLTPSMAAPREYHYVNIAKSWPDAQRYCREKFADLASIETEEEWAKVSTMMANAAEYYAWTGLYDDVYSWRWSSDNSSLYQGGNINLGSWFVASSSWQTETHCANYWQGTFYFVKCEAQYRSICYDEASNTYIAVTDEVTWVDALSYCRATYTDLAIIKTQEDLDAFKNVAADYSSWWVGLSRNGWAWSDNSDFAFRTWDDTQAEPNGGSGSKCGCTNLLGWHDGPCGWEIPFICTAPVRKVLNVGLKTDGSVDLNDLRVRGSLLEEIEKRMRDQGISDFRVIWKEQPNGKVFNKTETEL